MSFVGLTRAFMVAQKTNPLPFLFRMPNPAGGLLRIENPSASSVRLAYGDDVTDVEAGGVAVLDIRKALASITATLPAGANVSTAQLPVVVGYENGWFDQTKEVPDTLKLHDANTPPIMLFSCGGHVVFDFPASGELWVSGFLTEDAEVVLRGGTPGQPCNLRFDFLQDLVGGHAVRFISAGTIVGTIPAISGEPSTQISVVFSTSDGGNTITAGK